MRAVLVRQAALARSLYGCTQGAPDLHALVKKAGEFVIGNGLTFRLGPADVLKLSGFTGPGQLVEGRRAWRVHAVVQLLG